MWRINVVVVCALVGACAQRIEGLPPAAADGGAPDAGSEAVLPDAGSCQDTCTEDASACTDGQLVGCETDESGCREPRNRACPPGMLDWVTVEGGAFQMGSAAGSGDELPVHQVTVAPLQVTKTEITVRQYETCVTAGACSVPGTGANANWGTAFREYPVNTVTWQQAVSFCEWAGGRLPSEAEWESLAGGHRGFGYPWGTEPTTCDRANFDNGIDGCGTKRSAPVCSRPEGSSAEGLCDLAGNVWEWTADWYHASYDGAPVDGSAWVTPAGSNRVVRGGGYFNPEAWTRVSARFGVNPAGGYEDVGFRCVR